MVLQFKYRFDMENRFKGIEVKKDKVYKPVPVVQIVVVMALFFVALVCLDKCGIIEVPKNNNYKNRSK